MGGPKVRLISYTQPVDEIKNQGINDALELVAFCARVISIIARVRRSWCDILSSTSTGRL
jgi:hypothetical protein